MHYASGKTRIARQIAYEICKWKDKCCELYSTFNNNTHTHTTEDELTLVSLFCGGLSVETKLAPCFNHIICNDLQPYLIELYKALQNGWIPPDELSVEDYYYIKEHKDENKALTAFAGFGCSFGGKWFAGYGRHGTKDNHAKERSMCEESKRALLRDLEILKDAEFTCLDYKDVELPKGCVVYADPPYKGKMAAYGIKEKFDNAEFWDYMREISKDHLVFISELEAPDDFVAIWERDIKRQINNIVEGGQFKSTEKLFIYKDNVKKG